MSEQELYVEPIGDIGYVNLRGRSDNAGFRGAVETLLDQTLPIEPNTISDDKQRIFWLGPDEWLITSDLDAVSGLVAALEVQLAGQHAAVNDVSGGNVLFRICGSRARDLLAKGCTLDFHPNEFKVGTCAQSGLAKSIVLIGLVGDEPTFDVIVRRSFAEYLSRWLHHGGRECGIEFR